VHSGDSAVCLRKFRKFRSLTVRSGRARRERMRTDFSFFSLCTCAVSTSLSRPLPLPLSPTRCAHPCTRATIPSSYSTTYWTMRSDGERRCALCLSLPLSSLPLSSRISLVWLLFEMCMALFTFFSQIAKQRRNPALYPFSLFFSLSSFLSLSLPLFSHTHTHTYTHT